MEIIIKKTVTEKSSVKLPYYSKNDVAFYKIISENKMMSVYPEMGVKIEVYNFIIGTPFDTDCIQITEAEFNKAFAMANSKLMSLVNM